MQLAWFDDIERIVDLEDIQFTRNPRQLYDAHLRDPLISRRPERDVFVPMLAHALGRHSVSQRLAERTEILFLEAILHEVDKQKIVEYIAKREGVSKWAIYKRIERMDKTLTTIKVQEHLSNNAHQVPMYTRTTTRDELGRIRASVPRQCAGQGYNPQCMHTAPGQRSLCRSCFEQFVKPYGVSLDDIRPIELRDKIVKEARKIEAQHRRDCIEIMMTRALTAAAV